jgi:hypothetical protein
MATATAALTAPCDANISAETDNKLILALSA